MTIGSDLEIPELDPVETIPVEPDVTILPGSVPESLENPKSTGLHFQAKPGHFLLKLGSIARILISDGSRITVEAVPGADERDIRLYILGSAIGALLHQRGLLPFHASGIKTGDQCVMFCGKPGTGKSTLAGIFIKRGYILHADDICVVGLNNEGTPLAYPAYPQLKLWGDSLEKMGNEPTTYRPVMSTRDKLAVPAPTFNRKPLPIKKMFILAPHDKDTIEITPVTGMNKYKALKSQTYRRKFLPGLGMDQSHFQAAGLIGKHVEMYRVHRPQNLFLLDELADALEKNFREGD